jgi:hypothetical protein
MARPQTAERGANAGRLHRQFHRVQQRADPLPAFAFAFLQVVNEESKPPAANQRSPSLLFPVRVPLPQLLERSAVMWAETPRKHPQWSQ